MPLKLHGLVTATHTPFDADGRLNLSAVEKQAEHLLRSGVNTVFIGGTTGECHSLTVEERLSLASRWSAVVRGTKMRFVAHVGSNCLSDSRTLAAQAQSLGATAVAALAPSYFKPKSLDALIACSAQVAAAAPEVPFYFYDIPSFTGVQFSMPEFLAAAAERIPNLTGIKFTNVDLMSYQRCLHVQNGRFDMPFGLDELLLAALAVGAQGAVGSSYNFAAPLYLRVMNAFSRGEMSVARQEQFRAVEMLDLLAGFGYMAATKATMGFLGVNVGPPRLPISSLTASESEQLRLRLEAIGFFDWIRPAA